MNKLRCMNEFHASQYSSFGVQIFLKNLLYPGRICNLKAPAARMLPLSVHGSVHRVFHIANTPWM